jgi:hypothetical protein
MAPLQQSASLSLTFRSLPTSFLPGKEDTELSYSGIDRIPVRLASYADFKNARVNLTRQNQLILLKPMKKVLCSSRDCVPSKFNIKN